jgi:ABC-type nitrate/sulfonate/bicarbonate transport system permease component
MFTPMNKRLLFTGMGVIFIVACWLIGHWLWPDKIPSLWNVAISIYHNFLNVHWPNMLATIEHAFFGICIAGLISILVILLICLAPNFEYFSTPMAVLVKTSPVVALVPVFMIFFKSSGSIVAASIAISFFPIYIAGIDGLKRVPEKIIKLANIYNANRWNQFLHFKWGYVLESLLSSLKIAAPLSVVGAIVGEYIVAGSNDGMGVYIASNLGANPQPRFVGIVLATIIGLLFYALTYLIHHYYEKKLCISK